MCWTGCWSGWKGQKIETDGMGRRGMKALAIHSFFFLVLTLVTQIGGLVWLSLPR